jgi:hypothetical protein
MYIWGMSKDVITAAKYGFVAFIASGWLLTSIEYRKEVRARKAAEARYEYDFNGVLTVGKIPPRAAYFGCGYCDTLIAVDPETMDTVGRFSWKDSIWTVTYRPDPKDSVNVSVIFQ